MTTLLRRLICWVDGHEWRWQRNIYGSEREALVKLGVAAGSWWLCLRCGRREIRRVLMIQPGRRN